MKLSVIAFFAIGILSLPIYAADNASSSQTSSASTTENAVQVTPDEAKGKAAGIDTALAASAGGITATVLAVGAAAAVIAVALADSGGGDDPAPPVTAQAE